MTKSDWERVQALKKVGWAFGSAAWGCDNPKDEDYLVKPGDWGKIVGNDLGDHIHGGGFRYDGVEYAEASGDFRSFHITKGPDKPRYNFVVLNTDEEFELWRTASVLMTRIPAEFYQNKGKRIKLFEDFKELVGGDEWPELSGPCNSDPDDVPF